MRSVRVVLAALALGSFVALGCGASSKKVEAPAWARVALATSDADFVGAVDLEAMRADPLFARLIDLAARRADADVVHRASQVDIFFNTTDRGDVATWMGVVHGVSGQPTEHDLGHDYKKTVVFPHAWLVGEGPAFERAKGLDPDPKVSLPSHALFIWTARGRALTYHRHKVLDQTTEGLKDATMEVRGGSHLELVAQFHYIDDASAKQAAALARILLAALSKGDWSAKIAAALGKIDFDVSGDTVTVKYTLDDDVRDALVTLADGMK